MGLSPSFAQLYSNIMPTAMSAEHVHDKVMIGYMIATVTRSSFIRDDYKIPVKFIFLRVTICLNSAGSQTRARAMAISHIRATTRSQMQVYCILCAVNA